MSNHSSIPIAIAPTPLWVWLDGRLVDFPAAARPLAGAARSTRRPTCSTAQHDHAIEVARSGGDLRI